MRSVALVLSVCFLVVTFGLITAPYAAAAVVQKGSSMSADESNHYTAISGASPDLGDMVAGEWYQETWFWVVVIVGALVLTGVGLWLGNVF